MDSMPIFFELKSPPPRRGALMYIYPLWKDYGAKTPPVLIVSVVDPVLFMTNGTAVMV
jgi:hypothetical protein